MKAKAIKFLRKIIEVFFYMTSKAQLTKEKTDKLNIKIKNFHASYDIIKKVKERGEMLIIGETMHVEGRA